MSNYNTKDRAAGFADGVQCGMGILAGPKRSLAYLRGLEQALTDTLQSVHAEIDAALAAAEAVNATNEESA